MEEKFPKRYIKNTVALILTVVFILVCGFIYSYYIRGLTDTPPSVTDKVPGDGENLPPPIDEGGAVAIAPDITNENVIRVVKSMEKASAYYQEGAVEVISGSSSIVTKYKTWAKNGVYKCELTTENNTVNVVMTPKNSYYWASNSDKYYTAQTAEFKIEDVQGIPFVTELYDIPEDNVLSASVENHLNTAAIYTEVKDTSTGYNEKYWIGAQNGVLLKSETYKNGSLIYRFQTDKFTYDVPDDSVFLLPDMTNPLTAG